MFEGTDQLLLRSFVPHVAGQRSHVEVDAGQVVILLVAEQSQGVVHFPLKGIDGLRSVQELEGLLVVSLHLALVLGHVAQEHQDLPGEPPHNVRVGDVRLQGRALLEHVAEDFLEGDEGLVRHLLEVFSGSVAVALRLVKLVRLLDVLQVHAEQLLQHSLLDQGLVVFVGHKELDAHDEHFYSFEKISVLAA